jgi:hypothetical protein
VEIKLVRTYRGERCGGSQRSKIGRRRDDHGREANGCGGGGVDGRLDAGEGHWVIEAGAEIGSRSFI